jgi:hypothetical protein
MSSWSFAENVVSAAFGTLQSAPRVSSSILHPPTPAPHDYTPLPLAPGRSATFGTSVQSQPPRVPNEVRHPPLPSSLDYAPQILATGHEATMLNPTSAPSFGANQHAPRVSADVRCPPVPAPHDYAPKCLSSGSGLDFRDLACPASAAFGGTKSTVPRVSSRILHPPSPAPHDYTPGAFARSATGREVTMLSPSGVPSAAFGASKSAPRISHHLLHPPVPAPHYFPTTLASGYDASMLHLGGSHSRSRSAAFGPVQVSPSPHI